MINPPLVKSAKDDKPFSSGARCQVRQPGAQVLDAREVEDDAASGRRVLMEKFRVSDYQIIN